MSQASEVIIAEAQLEDAAALVDMLGLVGKETDYLTNAEHEMSVEQMAVFIQNRLASYNELCLLAKIGSEVVGLLNIAAQEDEATEHIGDLFISVQKKYWNQGLGHVLMETALDWAQQSGIIRRLELTVQTRNKPAVHLYEKFGFRIEGTKERGAKTKDGEFLEVYYMGKLID